MDKNKRGRNSKSPLNSGKKKKRQNHPSNEEKNYKAPKAEQS